MVKEDNAEYFVKIENPHDFRRTLLESSNHVVTVLQKYEMLRVLRVQKIKYMTELKDVIKDVQSLLQRIETVLPKTKIIKSKGSSKRKIVVHKKVGSELTDLEKELQNIQSKIKTMG